MTSPWSGGECSAGLRLRGACSISRARGPKLKKHLNTCYNKVCRQGVRATSFTFCMLSPVCIVKWQSGCIMLITNVARWLWPKSAKWCHRKLLDSAKSLVTNFQLKSAKSSEILLKNMLFLRSLKETHEVMQHKTISFSSCTRSQCARAENADLDHHTFRPNDFVSINILSNVTAAYLAFFVWHTGFDGLFQMTACFHTVEKCSTINNLSIASALKLSKAGICKNFALH